MKPKSLDSSFYIYKRLLFYARSQWVAVSLGILGTIISAGTDAGFTWLLKPLLDRGFIARDPVFIRWLPLIILVGFLIRSVAHFMSDYYMALSGRNVVMEFRQKLFHHFLHLPTSFYDRSSSGELLSTIVYDVEQVAKASTDALVTVVQETCFILGLLVVMFVTSWQLSLLFLISAPVIGLIARNSSRRMRHLSQSVQASMGSLTHISEEVIEGHKVIKTYGGQAYENQKFKRLAEKNRTREIKLVVTKNLASTSVQQMAAVVIALTVYLATARISHITAGGFTSLIAAMMALLKPLRNLTTVNSTIQKGIAGATSIFKRLDEPAEKNTGKQHLLHSKGRIDCKQITFNYPGHARTVLYDINFTVEPGQTLALVGRSGSGKSSLVSLFPRFYDNYSGKIFIDGQNILELRLNDLRKHIAIVSQHVTLFNDTIFHNIAYGKLDEASESEVIEVAKIAHVMEFVEQFPNGLRTKIGENGVLLSGGQRQRIAIARALLKDAPILILDEATASLDLESERYIQLAFDNLIKNRTTLVIAHRLSTVEKADKILVLDKGCIAESGTHRELLGLNGLYAYLYNMQFQDSESKKNL
jgi:ATP-binding cassette, subfamily B, bacterial MsbA